MVKAFEQNRKVFLDALPRQTGGAICLDEILDDRAIDIIKAIILHELKKRLIKENPEYEVTFKCIDFEHLESGAVRVRIRKQYGSSKFPDE